jgi:hypothetical protein
MDDATRRADFARRLSETRILISAMRDEVRENKNAVACSRTAIEESWVYLKSWSGLAIAPPGKKPGWLTHWREKAPSPPSPD